MFDGLGTRRHLYDSSKTFMRVSLSRPGNERQNETKTPTYQIGWDLGRPHRDDERGVGISLSGFRRITYFALPLF